MDLSISLTSDLVKAYFYKSLKEFDKLFKPDKHGNYIFKLSNIPKIKKIDYRGFINIRLSFIEAIKAKNYKLGDFLDVFYLGMHLFDGHNKKIHLKVTQLEREDYLKDKFMDFFQDIFSDDISTNAYLKGKNKEHSDTILFNTKNSSDYVFIEYAANIDKLDKDSFEEHHKGKIFEHLNRIVDVYSKEQIDCFHNTEKSKLEDFKLDKTWFIYFGKNINLEEVLKFISYEKYSVINVILVSYDFDNESFKILSSLCSSNEYNIYPE